MTKIINKLIYYFNQILFTHKNNKVERCFYCEYFLINNDKPACSRFMYMRNTISINYCKYFKYNGLSYSKGRKAYTDF